METIADPELKRFLEKGFEVTDEVFEANAKYIFQDVLGLGKGALRVILGVQFPDKRLLLLRHRPGPAVHLAALGDLPVEQFLFLLGTIPIINGYTMHEHPTQMLADFMTLDEVYGREGYRGRTFVYIGRGGACCAFSGCGWIPSRRASAYFCRCFSAGPCPPSSPSSAGWRGPADTGVPPG